MATTSLVVEFLLIGLIPFFTIAIGILLAAGVYDLRFLSHLKDFSVLLALCLTLVVYLLGALTHRLSQMVNVKSLRSFWKFGTLKPLGQLFDKSGKWHEDYYLVYQYGSEPLCDKITYNESLLRVFRSAALTVPILAVVLTFWLSKAVGWAVTWAALGACAAITLAAVIAIPIQYKNYREIIEFSATTIRKHRLNKVE
jgi:hypothetical protein